MRFSDIHMIMIGEEGEYGRRLVRYLETHLSTAIRVYHFTTTESFLAFKERADIYLLDEAFFQRLSEEKQNVLLREKRLILLTAQEEEGTFCKYHNPKKLLDRLSRFSDEMEDETHTLFQYDKDHGLEIREELFHVEKLKDYGQYEKYCEAVKLFREGRAEQKKARA